MKNLKYFISIIITIIITTLIIFCFYKSKENEDRFAMLVEESEREADSIRRVESKQRTMDSIRHLVIQDSLKVVDGKRIIGDIYFGMTQKQYELSKDKLLNKCGGSISIGNCKFDINRAYFDLGELYGVRLHSDCLKSDWYDIAKMFLKKYGPASISNRYVKQWKFNYKFIDIRYESSVYGNDLLNNGDVIIEILNPAILDSISIRNREEQEKKKKIEEENKNTSKIYSKQL